VASALDDPATLGEVRGAGCAGVLGVGTALPEEVLSSAQVAAGIGVDEQWIVRRTGIAARRRAAPGAELSELAAEAGRAALEHARLPAAELDLVLVATFTADAIVPPASAEVAHRLGALTAGAFDVNGACTGFLSALATADALIGAGAARTALVVGAEIISRRLDSGDRNTAAVFGDGAGAVVLGADSPGRLGPFVLGADGSQSRLITIDAASGTLRMDGHETFKQAVARMQQVSLDACSAAGVGIAEIDLFVFHQANSRITATLMERLGVDPEKVVDCIAQLGNTSAASIPLALSSALADGRLRPGARVLLAAVGAGFTWAGAVMVWGASA
jgi:3-oxoacyl-[acyl-carrier-protein] synthase III